MDYKYSFTDDTTYVLAPLKATMLYGNTRILNQLTEVSLDISTVH